MWQHIGAGGFNYIGSVPILVESSLFLIRLQLLLIELKQLFVEEENILYGVRLTNSLEVEIEVSDVLSIGNSVSCLICFTIFDIPLLDSLLHLYPIHSKLSIVRPIRTGNPLFK
ncbi:hypothetical protein [Psychrobacillus insolitus]|uniref:hypothetical protein n=1 Tax=Psychrobacillus insolitus TaxID=1461 RepID=UPI000DAB8AB4|nr:hypothetical protein [Psychrobacillus insolitus]